MAWQYPLGPLMFLENPKCGQMQNETDGLVEKKRDSRKRKKKKVGCRNCYRAQTLLVLYRTGSIIQGTGHQLSYQLKCAASIHPSGECFTYQL